MAVQESLEESEELEAESEAWLFEKDPATAAEIIADKMRSDIFRKMAKKGW